MSDTIGAEYRTFISWMLCMGCCMYNLEHNIPVEIRGCTAFAYTKEGRVIYGRNNDLPPYLRDGSKSEIYTPENGNRFNITTSSFINGEEGLNEHGLAVAMTFVMTDIAKIQAGFNACFLVRYLLEKVSAPMIKCKKTPKKKSRFMAWRKKDRLLIGQKCLGRESENERRKLDGHTK